MKIRTPILFAAALLSLAASSQAQQVEIGKTEFMLRCAACHGPGGKGDGAVGQLLKVPPPDLTRIAERNGGTFPFQRIYDIIDGRQAIAAHGTREMPVWGDSYRAEQFPMKPLAENATEAQIDAPERAVERYILALVYYIGTLQGQN
ncbi:c-type cytochrome [Aestuariivirga sp.]|uniref:c-type cytochrome n=1 Tax=Aestuariivirga sp. TaxID=2650926 RepID=UPI00391D0AD0